MNIMTVTDVQVDIAIKIQSNDEGSAQDFASELDRASSNDNNTADVQQPLKADKKAQTDDRTETVKKDEEIEDEPEEQKKIHGMNSVPVVLCEQNTEVMPAAEQNATTQTAGENVLITALETPSQGDAHNAEQAALPNAQSQYLPQNAMPNPIAQAAVQKAAPENGNTQNEPLMQDADAQKNASGNPTAVQNAAPPALENAQAFAGQALREIADLKKASENSTQSAENPVQNAEKPAQETTLSAMQQTVQTAQTLKNAQHNEYSSQPAIQNTEQPAVQNAQQQDGQQPGLNALKGETQSDTSAKEQTAGGETKQNAQDGMAKESSVTQMQTTFSTSSAKVEFQQNSAQLPEQPVVRQNVMTTIIDKISTAFGKDTTQMEVQLKPEHLGGLSISLSMGESGLVAKMVTSEQSVRNMIHGEISMLQEVLREKGIPVVHMEVSYGQTTNTSANNQGGNGGNWTTSSYTGDQPAYDNSEESVNYLYNLSNYDLLTEQGGSVEFSA